MGLSRQILCPVREPPEVAHQGVGVDDGCKTLCMGHLAFRLAGKIRGVSKS